MKNLTFLAAILFIFVGTATSSFASEQLGSFSLSDFLIQPNFNVSDLSGSQFSLYKSYLFFNWEYKKAVSAQIGIGSLALVNPSRFTTPITPTANLGIIEASAQWETGYGLVKAGLIPLQFGWEGKDRESSRILPDTMFLENRYYGLRDYGASYFVAYNGFYTNVVVHNGEGGTDTDGLIWYTTNFGWKSRAGFDVGMSGSVGKFATTTDVTKTRIGNIYAGINFYKTTFLAEGFVGETKGTSTRTQFVDWHIDLAHPIFDDFGVQLRYEYLDASLDVTGDQKYRWILGFNVTNEAHTSTLYLWGIKNVEESNEIKNDSVMLSWKVNSVLL